MRYSLTIRLNGATVKAVQVRIQPMQIIYILFRDPFPVASHTMHSTTFPYNHKLSVCVPQGWAYYNTLIMQSLNGGSIISTACLSLNGKCNGCHICYALG